MPRDASGNFALTPSTVAPAVTLTTISATDFNAALADIANEIEDSLSRSGKGGMATPMQFMDGSEVEPGLSFTNETGSGMYRAGAGDVRVSILGNDQLRATATGVTVDNALAVGGNATVTGDLTVTGNITGVTTLTNSEVAGSGATSSPLSSVTELVIATTATMTPGSTRPFMVYTRNTGITATPGLSASNTDVAARSLLATVYRKLDGGAWSMVAAAAVAIPPSNGGNLTVPAFLDVLPAFTTVAYELRVLASGTNVSFTDGGVYLGAYQV